MKSASRVEVRVAGALAAAVLAAVVSVSAQSRGPSASTPAWLTCAGGTPGQAVHPITRLTALTDKAVVEPDVARVFAQREKEQRVSAVNLSRARLSIDFLYAAGDGPARQYYYEASKTIPDAGGLLRVAVAGWLRGDGRAPVSLGSKGELHWIELMPEDPDGEHPVIPDPPPIPEPAASLVPMGVLAQATGRVWVMKRGIGSGTLLVYDVGPKGVQLRPKSTVKGCS